MNAKDTFQIICSFLQPIELVRMRKLSIMHNQWTNNYTLKHYNTINLQDKTCPKCGHWITSCDISNYNDFYDYFLMDEWKRFRFSQINEWFNSNYVFDVKRKSLLCEDCEPIEDYNSNFYTFFRYKGTREYTLVSFYGLYSWSALCIVNETRNDRKGYWNEYRKVLSCTFENIVKSEGYYGSWDNWDNDEEDEEDDNEY